MKVETFRKLIREEVKRAIREELPTLLTEIREQPTATAKPGRAFSDLFEGIDQKLKKYKFLNRNDKINQPDERL